MMKISYISIRTESQERNNALFSTCRKIRHYVSIIRVCNGNNKVRKGSPGAPRCTPARLPAPISRQSELMVFTFISRPRKELKVFSLTLTQVCCSPFILRGRQAFEKKRNRPLLSLAPRAQEGLLP